MDKSTPDGPNASNSPWPKDSGSAEGLRGNAHFWNGEGARTDESTGRGLRSRDRGSELPYAGSSQNRSQRIAKPSRSRLSIRWSWVGRGDRYLAGACSIGCGRQRRNERRLRRTQPATEPGGKGSGGFTELLRTAGSDSPHRPPGNRAPCARDAKSRTEFGVHILACGT